MRQAFILRFPGATLDQYDQVVEKMELGGQLPPGGVFHWVTQTDDGIMVVDVWESAEQFQDFAETKIVPITGEVGLAPPEIEQHEVHNTLPTP